MMQRRQLRWVLALLTAMAVLAGCGGQPKPAPASPPTQAPSSAPAPAPQQPTQPVTVTHWQHHDDARAAVLKELAADFMAANPGIKVELQTIPYNEYFDKLLSAIAAGSGPDVFQIPLTMAPEMIASGRLAPLPGNVMSAAEVNDKYVAWTVELAQKDGKVYGLPTDVQTLVLFINADLAREAGLDPAKPPTTWKELVEQSARATKKDANGLVQAGLDTRYKWADYNLFLIQAVDPVVDLAARKVNYDSPVGMEAWNLVYELMVKQGVDSPRFMTGQTKWEQKRAVFYINHPVARRRPAIAQAPFKWVLALPPRKDAGSPLKIPGHSWLYVLNRDAKQQEAAARWIKFLANRDAVKKWANKAGDLPSLKELLTDPELTRDENDKLVLESMKYAVPVRQTGAKDVNDIRDEIWDNIVIKGMAVSEAVKAGAAKENALIQKKLGK